MRKLKKFFFVLAVFSAVFLQPLSAQSYTITEEELQQIEVNQEQILTESQKQKEQSEKAMDELNKQLQKQIELLEKSEKEKDLLLKVGIPAAALLMAGAFCVGIYAGIQAQ